MAGDTDEFYDIDDLLSLYMGDEPGKHERERGSGKKGKKAGGAGNAPAPAPGAGSALDGYLLEAMERTVLKRDIRGAGAEEAARAAAADREYGHALAAIVRERGGEAAAPDAREAARLAGDLLLAKKAVAVPLGKNAVLLPADAVTEITGRVAYEYERFEETGTACYSKRLEPDGGTGESRVLYLSDLSAFHGDRIRCLLNRRTGVAYMTGTIEEHDRVLGRLRVKKDRLFLAPDDPRFGQLSFVFRSAEDVKGAQMGSVLICRIVSRSPDGVYGVVALHDLQDGSALDSRIEMAIVSRGIPREWGAAVKKQLAGIPDEVPEKDKDLRKGGRADLRGLPLVTIDGADARDFDDAVYCRREGSGFRLFVAIADVSFYVRNGSPLDAEAKQRGTSVYFPNYVVPMLPEKLSNGLCSLNPHADRLCMVCEVEVKKGGALGDYRFYPAVMNSHARLTYDEVADVLAGAEVTDPEILPLKEDLLNLYELYKALKLARETRGGITFEDGGEVSFVFDENRRITDVIPVVRNDAHMLIEECMIAANVCAATFVERCRGFTLYRVHPKPSAQKVDAFRKFIAPYGLGLGGGAAPASADYAKFAESIADSPYREALQIMMLRSLELASYTPRNEGHFGLALARYAHFTSPIRRYPDLQLHREIKFLLGAERLCAPRFAEEIGAKEYALPELDALGESCSAAERRADAASGEVERSMKTAFMEKFIGKNLPGVVTNVTRFGLFVKIERFGADGLIHISEIASNQYFEFDERRMRLTAPDSGFSVGLGDRLTVTVKDVNVEEGKIDLVPAPGTFGAKKDKLAGEAREFVGAWRGGAGIPNEAVSAAVRRSLALWNGPDAPGGDVPASFVEVRKVPKAPHAAIKRKKKQ